MVAPLIIASLISAAVQTTTTVIASKKEKRARQAQRRQSASQAAIERRQEVRDTRIQRARLLSQSAEQGTDQSSGLTSSLGSIVSQTGVNQSARTITQGLSNEAGAALQQAANIRGVGGVAAQFAGNSASLFS